MNLRQLFNRSTQIALSDKISGYLSKEFNELELEQKIRRDYGCPHVYRFDLGRNTDGFSAMIGLVAGQTDMQSLIGKNLTEYPDNHYKLLKNELSKKFSISSDRFLFSTGLDSIIDVLTRIFLNEKDTYVIPVPNFYLFEEYSVRAGAVPIYYRAAREKNYYWAEEDATAICRLIKDKLPKLVWISNPVNPTGQLIPHESIKEILKTAAAAGTFVIVDEAYGEYTDDGNIPFSATKFVDQYNNLAVLRTFSKIYALPSLRVGYLITSSQDVLSAMSVYIPYYPVTWFSLYIAQIAFVDEDWIPETQRNMQSRSNILFSELSNLKTFDYIPSKTNVFLMSHKFMSGTQLTQKLMQKGILVANHATSAGLGKDRFIRVTIRNEEDNRYFVETCKTIEDEIQKNR